MPIGVGISRVGLPLRHLPAVAGGKLLIAILGGQSNQVGYGANRDDAVDTDYTGIYQFGGESHSPYYQSITSDIIPLYHNDSAMILGNQGNTGTTSFLSPGEYMAREAIESGYVDKVLLVPVARGSSRMHGLTEPTWHPASSGGGSLFEFMIAQTNAAVTAAASYADFSGADVEIVFFWIQGEQDATDGVSQAVYAADMATLITQCRARITGAVGAKFVIGSMVPNYWLPDGANYDPAMDLINRAHVQASLENSNTFYALGADGNITNNGRHYGTQALIREEGRRMARIFAEPASLGPNITTSATATNTVGSALAINITTDAYHATFAITGGANASEFELSEPYPAPVLRWIGDGTGPTSAADYDVEITAYDGGGIAGTPLTLTVTVEAASDSLPQQSSIGLWLEAAPANLLQSNTGTTAVTSDADPVGFWADKSSNGFDISSVADDTTRPLYKTDGSVSWVEFDGANDVLRRLASLNLWNASGYTLVIAMRSLSNGAGKYLVSEGNDASSNQLMGAINSAAVANQLNNFYRSDSGANITNSGASTADNAFDGTDHVLTVVDDGSSVTAYIDGVVKNTLSYTRAGNTMTLNRFALGALVRNTMANYFPARVHGLAIWPAVNLTSLEMSEALTYFGNLQGRSL